ncbi:MAG: bifunctional phosphoribosylaminoimidazolecarboxamide formyltransferase/IMP cyclohydrolase PurH [Elusimicrobia bacterium CG08_land_8_20_14_0_20_44_26]|nr:MAG: bifunctional phosphoribosylaminoimidazolecarboxamide formyltransferase/IMP cyclohydrolase PurH [Elusimicrobia bacterium CG08_land_8_20_14_0_20_44_26]
MRALISVTDKSGLEEFCRGLKKNGWVITATSGTAAYLKSKNIPADDTSALTGFAEMLGGRVKTLHPMVFGGILARAEDKADIKKFKLPLIDMVAVNFYKLKKGRNFEETIDIGGLALLRAAAKNYKRVICLCDPNDYKCVLEAVEKGRMDEKMRRSLAVKAFELCALYNKRIVDIMSPARREFPEYLSVSSKKIMNLRYGENPHQKAAFYSEKTFPGKILQGKPLSYNNILDIEAAILPVLRFSTPGCVIIKHTNPCGAAVSAKQEEAYKNALACDRVSAFGGIVSFNRKVSEKTAALVGKHFFEVVAAPNFDAGARKILAQKPKLILFKYHKWDSKKALRSALGGYLVQEAKFPKIKLREACGKLTKAERDDIAFGLNIAFSAASNASVIVKNGKTIGICPGQCSRIESVKIAIRKAIKVAGKRTKGMVLVSDGFFPFDDSIRAAASAGIKVVAAPAGSVKDKLIAAAAKKLGVKLAFIGNRLFRH